MGKERYLFWQKLMLLKPACTIRKGSEDFYSHSLIQFTSSFLGKLTCLYHNNNNNNRICIARVCRMTSEALDGQLQSCYAARATPKCLTHSTSLELYIVWQFCQSICNNCGLLSMVKTFEVSYWPALALGSVAQLAPAHCTDKWNLDLQTNLCHSQSLYGLHPQYSSAMAHYF